jgi:hypothetical protein
MQHHEIKTAYLGRGLAHDGVAQLAEDGGFARRPRALPRHALGLDARGGRPRRALRGHRGQGCTRTRVSDELHMDQTGCHQSNVF